MPPKESIREKVLEAVSVKPSHLQSIYSFVLRFRPATAKETIRARVYEAVAKGSIRRLAPGVYVAVRGEASLLLVEGDAREVLASLDDGCLDAILTDPPYDLGTRKHAQTGTTRPHQGKGRTYDQWDLGEPNVLRHKRLPRRKGEHEAEKPAGLFWDLARAVTRAGDVVADFLVGRGRWIGRFLEEGRHVVAVDRNPYWIEKIRGDFSQMRLGATT